ncbi:hypothetical protein GGS26DRAFT_543466 [Hypomontagnella submonticulosa]|nr:hypothetical protein GGS26DRAFT_543466 [Hypomontagnella submonticulosa]
MGKPEDSGLQETSGGDVAPPPSYTEAVRDTQRDSPAPPPDYDPHAPKRTTISPYQPFPQLLEAHYQWTSASVFHLGDSANKRLFAVSVHTGLGGKGPGRPGMILHNGPTDKDPMLAASSDEGKASTYSPNSIITLPALSNGASGGYCTEIMRAARSLDTAVFRFSIEVEQKELRREDFEWRKSKGDEVKDFVEPPWKCGFKLVRLSTQQNSTSNGSAASQRVTSADQEVVAVFVWSSTWSVMAPFRVQFRGSGRDGSLGERFTLMTAITSLRLWWLKLQGRTSESTIAAGEVGLVPGATG